MKLKMKQMKNHTFNESRVQYVETYAVLDFQELIEKDPIKATREYQRVTELLRIYEVNCDQHVSGIVSSIRQNAKKL